ncbi:MAG: hypothetical protein QXY35_09410 [Thermofilaceae archaeon]
MNKRTCMILMVAGGAFYVAGGFVASLLVGVLGGFAAGLTGSPEVAKWTRETVAATIAVGAVSGTLIIIGGVLVNSEVRSRRIVGSALGIIGALIGIANTFAGLIVGLVLTLVGAVGGITYKPSTPQLGREPGEH